MGSCTSTNGITNSASENDDIVNLRNTNIDHNSNLKQASSTVDCVQIWNFEFKKLAIAFSYPEL